MANFGRFVCVAIPFALTLASLIAMLVAGLAGIMDKSLYMFQVNTTDLSMSPTSINSILNGSGISIPGVNAELNIPDINIPDINIPDINIPDIHIGKRADAQTTNITAKDLGLYDVYDVSIWGYCYTPSNGSRECTKAAFNWATNALNTTTGDFNYLLTSTGLNVSLPSEITDAVKLFGNVSRWTQIVFIIAYVALGVELFFGLFAGFSRIFSCITWLVAFIATAAVCAAAGLATATAIVVTGAVEATAALYSVDAHVNTRFLATVWIGAAFAIAAGLFWLFSVCCCAPDHSSRSRDRPRGGEAEKFIPGNNSSSYSRLSGPDGGYAGGGYARQSHGPVAQHGGAYEPYSHARV
jgi:hypothetical protein